MSLFNNSTIELKYHQHLNLNHIYLVFMYGIHNAILQLPTGYEFLIIIVIIVVLFFGVKKIPELARSFGKATAEYEKARIEAKKELIKLKVKIRWDAKNSRR